MFGPRVRNFILAAGSYPLLDLGLSEVSLERKCLISVTPTNVRHRKALDAGHGWFREDHGHCGLMTEMESLGATQPYDLL